MIGVLEKRYVRYPVYAAFGLFVFVISLVIAFPDDEVKDIMTVQIERALGQEYKVTIEDLDLWWLTGVQLENVTIEERKVETDKSETEEGAVGEEEVPEIIPMKFTLPEVSARLALLRSIFGPTVEFDIDAGGGNIEGHFQQGESNALYVEFDELDLRQTEAIAAFLGVPFFGELSGEIDLELDPKTNLPQDGTITFDGEKLTFGPAVVKTDKLPAMAFIEVPQTNLGTLDVDIGVDSSNPKRPVLEFDTFAMKGRDMMGDVWGVIRPSSKFGLSILDLQMRMQFDETYVKKNSLAPLLNVSEVRKGKNKQWYGFAFSGRVSNIQFKGQPAAASGPSASGKKPGSDEPKSDE